MGLTWFWQIFLPKPDLPLQQAKRRSDSYSRGFSRHVEGTHCELSNSEAELVEGDMESINIAQLFYLYVCISEDDAEARHRTIKYKTRCRLFTAQKHYALLLFIKNDIERMKRERQPSI